MFIGRTDDEAETQILFGHLMQKSDSFEKTLMLGETEGTEEGNRGGDGWMASPTQWRWV